MKVCKYCETTRPDEADVCPGCGARDYYTLCPECGETFEGPACPRCGLTAGRKPRVCPSCGSRYHTRACPACGYESGAAAAPVRTSEVPQAPQNGVSPKSRLAALLLLLFLGIWGIHRFYVGKAGTGILYFFTFGLFGIGWLVDLILIACGSFRDRRGLVLTKW